MLHDATLSELNEKYGTLEGGRHQGESAAVTVCLTDVVSEPIRWLWSLRFPLGKVSIICGDPGLGKSLITLTIAATVSRGGSWPCGEGQAPLADVVLISAEDDVADTIRPRLEAANADISRVHILSAVDEVNDAGEQVRRPWTLRDMESLDRLLEFKPECRLVIVDPLSAYLGGTDSHINADVRALLMPLAELAARRRVAVICVSHLNKSGGPAIYRVTGSLAFVAAARAAYAVAKDREDPSRRLVFPLKANNAPDQNGLAYRIGVGNNDIPVIQWEAETISVLADDALEVTETNQGGWSELEEAVDWLRDYLGSGPRPTQQVRNATREAGLAWATVRRARAVLGVTTTKTGFEGGWVWALPPKMLTPHEDAQAQDVSTFGQAEQLRESVGCTAEEYRRAKDGE